MTTVDTAFQDAVKTPGKRDVWRASGLRRERWYGYLFLGPAIVTLSLLIATPLIQAFWTSLHRTRGLRSSFVGFDNYAYILQNSDFWHSLSVSAVFTVACVFLHVSVGMLLALGLNSITYGRTLLRLGFLMPWIVAPSIGSVIWVWLLEPQFGVINYILESAGLIRETALWLADPVLALVSVITVDFWRGMPFVMLLLLAGLQGIPRDQYEAAALDGANAWQQFRHVTLPNLRYLLIVAATLDTIYTVRHFDVIAVMTGGGPAGSTEVLPVMIYNTAFEANRLGRASAIGILLLGIVLTLSVLYLYIVKPEKDKGGA
ncbi:sugar ABC transporter permease [uncultured Roseibium sp.]|jgi:multiple sugar transport system permease protein|uniref:carbohydrate ABC transporter permease n=1 Tax=uncultured Roseibium sp. TaxID=1936171 RepID=UPI002620C123|nr:sugar ABC transporter permease [uncultured Roseibium sp.]